MRASRTGPEIADALRCGEWKVKQVCRSGQLRAVKPAGKWLSTDEWIAEFAASTGRDPRHDRRRGRFGQTCRE